MKQLSEARAPAGDPHPGGVLRGRAARGSPVLSPARIASARARRRCGFHGRRTKSWRSIDRRRPTRSRASASVRHGRLPGAREIARLDAPSRAVHEAVSRLQRAAAEHRAAERTLRVRCCPRWRAAGATSRPARVAGGAVPAVLDPGCRGGRRGGRRHQGHDAEGEERPRAAGAAVQGLVSG